MSGTGSITTRHARQGSASACRASHLRCLPFCCVAISSSTDIVDISDPPEVLGVPAAVHVRSDFRCSSAWRDSASRHAELQLTTALPVHLDGAKATPPQLICESVGLKKAHVAHAGPYQPSPFMNQQHQHLVQQEFLLGGGSSSTCQQKATPGHDVHQPLDAANQTDSTCAAPKQHMPATLDTSCLQDASSSSSKQGRDGAGVPAAAVAGIPAVVWGLHIRTPRPSCGGATPSPAPAVAAGSSSTSTSAAPRAAGALVSPPKAAGSGCPHGITLNTLGSDATGAAAAAGAVLHRHGSDASSSDAAPPAAAGACSTTAETGQQSSSTTGSCNSVHSDFFVAETTAACSLVLTSALPSGKDAPPLLVGHQAGSAPLDSPGGMLNAPGAHAHQPTRRKGINGGSNGSSSSACRLTQGSSGAMASTSTLPLTPHGASPIVVTP
jgi:hypothetical protein